ncbi:hypothetical protein N7V53_16640 [Kosakonia sp. HypNH10]|uniref:hypothetical protein n=1 Tax=Kosakonia sp. HypNH10 TaxID=2980101 RepID=UPI0024469098|nr:hypothetical protein [Kosakonia sp. HypNH10]MDH2914147.1 hypothetical protein [Kosakonia sp. HypNH10]
MTIQGEKILSDIYKAYGDLSSPNFSFVMKSYNSLKYKKILSDIYSLFKVKDHTDLNYDVCVSLELEYLKRPIYLYLSLVSTYAFVFYEGKVIDCNDDVYQALSGLANILNSHGFVLMDKENLLCEFDMDVTHFDAEGKKASILGLLFSFGLSVN